MHIIVLVVAFLAAEVQPVDPFFLLFVALIRPSLIRIHERDQLRLDVAFDVQTPRPMAILAAIVAQQGRGLFVTEAARVFEPRDVATNAFPVELLQ